MAMTTEYPILPDYEELPPPQPIQQATADEAGKHVLESMVDLYEWSGGGAAALVGEPSEQFLLDYIQLAYYIMRHEKAQHYIATQPAISAELRRYTSHLLGTVNSIYWTLCDFDYMLKALGA